MDIVAAIGCSHAGLLRTHADKATPDQGDRVYGAFDVLRRRIEDLQPDAIVILATDHGRIYGFDLLPPFVIGVSATAETIGDSEQPIRSVPIHQSFAQWILGDLVEQGVDLAYSESMRIDHSFVIPLSFLTPNFDVPIIPIVQNCSRPPMPTLERSHEVGRKLGAAIRSGGDGRVVVVGTGGLSHWVGDEKRRSFLTWPAGTRYGHETEFPFTLTDVGRISAEFDTTFLDALAAGGARGYLDEWPHSRVVEEGGTVPRRSGTG